MRVFLTFISENRDARELLISVAKNYGHQGSVIRFSNNFLTIFEASKYDPDDFLRIIDEYFYYNRRGGICFPQININNISKINYSDVQRVRRRLSEIFNKPLFRFYRPFEVVICIYNDADSELFESIIREFINNEEFNIVIEKRSRNELLSGSRDFHQTIKGGISIGRANGNYGTLGGILKDDYSNVYALTCSHVLQKINEKVYQPSWKDSNNAREIGEVELISDIIWNDADSACSPRIDSSEITNTDSALIKLSDNAAYDCEIHNLGKIVGMKSFDDIRQNMEVEFNGRTTNKRKKLLVGGLCVSYKVSSQKKSACFTNLIELRETSSMQICGYNVQSIPVEKGDSGSWICSNDQNGYNWTGMLISGDSDRGYFIAAEDINNWLTSNNYNLSPC